MYNTINLIDPYAKDTLPDELAAQKAQVAAGYGKGKLGWAELDHMRETGQTDLSGRDCSGFDFFAYCLHHRLEGLDGFNFTSANLTRTNFQAMKLTNCDFTGAKLTNSELRLAKLDNANLAQANFEGSSLKEAQFTNAQGAETASFRGVELGKYDLIALDDDGRNALGLPKDLLQEAAKPAEAPTGAYMVDHLP